MFQAKESSNPLIACDSKTPEMESSINQIQAQGTEVQDKIGTNITMCMLCYNNINKNNGIVIASMCEVVKRVAMLTAIVNVVGTREKTYVSNRK